MSALPEGKRGRRDRSRVLAAIASEEERCEGKDRVCLLLRTGNQSRHRDGCSMRVLMEKKENTFQHVYVPFFFFEGYLVDLARLGNAWTRPLAGCQLQPQEMKWQPQESRASDSRNVRSTRYGRSARQGCIMSSGVLSESVG